MSSRTSPTQRHPVSPSPKEWQEMSAGKPLETRSSFEKLLQSNVTQGTDAATAIATWWKKQRRILAVFHDVLACKEIATFALSQLSLISSQTFEDAQNLLQSAAFQSSLQSLLKSLPKDPNISQKNASIARSPRTHAYAILIAYFARKVLVSDAAAEIGDDSVEATRCHVSALALIRSFRKLLYLISTSSSTSLPSIRQFRQVLLTYRFGIRKFTDDLALWRHLDQSRIVQTMEITYLQCYSVYVQTMEAEPGTEEEEIARNSHLQCLKVKQALTQLLGEAKALSKIEELEAQVKLVLSSVNDNKDEVSTSSSLSSSSSPASLVSHKPAMPPPTSSPSVHHTTKQVNATAAQNTIYSSLNSDAPSLSPPLPPSERELQLLNKLAELSGQENERLAHEIILDPSFRLKDVVVAYSTEPFNIEFPPPSSNTTGELAGGGMNAWSSPQNLVNDPLTAAAKMTELFKRLIGDRLVNSLTPSKLESYQDISVGSVVQVAYGHSATGEPFFLTAKVLAIIPSPASSSDESSTPPPHSNTISAINVLFLCDNTMENEVALSRVKLASQLPDAQLLIQAIDDLIERVASLVPKQPALLASLRAGVDGHLITQMVAKKAMDTRDLLTIIVPIARTLQTLQAEARADVFDAWLGSFIRCCYSFEKTVRLLPAFFETVASAIDEVRRDMANYFISSIAPLLQREGTAFLASAFRNRLLKMKPEQMLIKTIALISSQVSTSEALAATVASIEEAMATGTTTTPLTAPSISSLPVNAIVAQSLIALLQSKVRLTSHEAQERILPETWQWDGERLAKLRDAIDTIALQVSLVVTIKQQLGRYRQQYGIVVVMTEEEETAVQVRLDVLLREKDCNITNVTTEALRCGHACIARAGGNTEGLSSTWDEDLKASVVSVVNESNPVLNLFTKRLYKILLRSMLGQPYLPKLQQYSLHSKAQEKNIGECVKSISVLFNHHMNVFKHYYSLIVKSLSSSDSS